MGFEGGTGPVTSIASDDGRALCFRDGDLVNFDSMLLLLPEASRCGGGGGGRRGSATTSALAISVGCRLSALERARSYVSCKGRTF